MKFIKNVLALFFALLLCVFVLLIAGIVVISFVSTEKTEAIKENSVLTLTFSHPIVERIPESPLEMFRSFSDDKREGLDRIRKVLKNTAEDTRIKGIFLSLNDVNTGWATLNEIRRALMLCREKGKFIYAYGEQLSEKAYYLCSVADSIFLNPKGTFEFNGFSTTHYYYLGTFEKLGVDMKLIRHGKFKSAGERFTRKNMSDEHREVVKKYLNDLYDVYLSTISESRKIAVPELRRLAGEMRIIFPEDALKAGLADVLAYKDEVKEKISLRLGQGPEEKKINEVMLNQYYRAVSSASKGKHSEKNGIAVLYVSGGIFSGSGKGNDEMVGSETISEALNEIRGEDKIRAVVLRVNSPGGGVIPSDVIWREVSLTATQKPVIVSMGDLAASGGYYISAPALKIVCEPTTLTGSIGVFGLVPNLQKFLNEKVGITADGVGTGNFSDFPNIFRPLRPDEEKLFQTWIDSSYFDFVQKVGRGRKLSLRAVKEVAEGRLWSGSDALKNGLADTLGGFNEALQIAVTEARMKEGEYFIREYPRRKGFFEIILDKMGAGLTVFFNKRNLYENFFEFISFLREKSGIYALYPFQTDIH